MRVRCASPGRCSRGPDAPCVRLVSSLMAPVRAVRRVRPGVLCPLRMCKRRVMPVPATAFPGLRLRNASNAAWTSISCAMDGVPDARRARSTVDSI